MASNKKLNQAFGLLLLVLVIFPACRNGYVPEMEGSNDRDALLQCVEEFNIAFREGDNNKLASLITEEYVHTNGGAAPIGRKAWLAYLEKRKRELISGELVVKNYRMDDYGVTTYGDMAIVTGKISFLTIRPDEEKEHEIRITTVWVKEAGTWKRAAFHDTRIR